MNNEIKEINIKIPGQILDYVDTKEHLLDLFNYITNLQEENEMMRKLIDEGVENSYKKLKYLQQENEGLKEANKILEENWKHYMMICGKAIEYNYELQERYCHSAIRDELVASKIYEITEKELNILQNGSEEK